MVPRPLAQRVHARHPAGVRPKTEESDVSEREETTVSWGQALVVSVTVTSAIVVLMILLELATGGSLPSF